MISVIIPSYNSGNTIEKCLDSLLYQSYRGNYEITLVDIVKFIRTLAVFLRYQPGVIIKKSLTLMLFVFAVFFWVIGFARGACEKKSL